MQWLRHPPATAPMLSITAPALEAARMSAPALGNASISTHQPAQVCASPSGCAKARHTHNPASAVHVHLSAGATLGRPS